MGGYQPRPRNHFGERQPDDGFDLAAAIDAARAVPPASSKWGKGHIIDVPESAGGGRLWIPVEMDLRPATRPGEQSSAFEDWGASECQGCRATWTENHRCPNRFRDFFESAFSTIVGWMSALGRAGSWFVEDNPAGLVTALIGFAFTFSFAVTVPVWWPAPLIAAVTVLFLATTYAVSRGRERHRAQLAERQRLSDAADAAYAHYLATGEHALPEENQ